MTNSRAPWLHGYYPASSLLWAPPTPSRLPPISWVLQLYGFPAPPISRRDEEGFSSCFACPCHRAVASHPARVDVRFSQVRPSMLPSPYSCRLSLWGHSLSRPHLRSLSLRPNGSLSSQRMIWSIGFKDSVSFLLAIQVTSLLTFAPVGTHLPLNTPAFAGHTTGRAVFPHPALRSSSSGGLRRNPSKWLTLPTV